MTLEDKGLLPTEDISPGLVGILLRVAADRAAKIIQLVCLLFKVGELRREKANIFVININHRKKSIADLHRKVNSYFIDSASLTCARNSDCSISKVWR